MVKKYGESRLKRKASSHNIREGVFNIMRRVGGDVLPPLGSAAFTTLVTVAEEVMKANDSVLPNKMDAIHSGVTQVNIHVPATLKANKNKSGSFKLREVFSTPSQAVPEGQQSVTFLGSVGDMANVMCTNTALGNSSLQYSPYNYFSLNPDSQLTGSDLGWTLKDQANQKLNLDHAEFSITVKNLTTVLGAYVDIYCVEAKKHIEKAAVLTGSTPGIFVNRSSVDVWAASLTNQGLGLNKMTGGTAGVEDTPIVGSRPTDGQAFKDLYKIKAVHHINLAAGSEETVNFNCPLHMTFKGDKLIQENSYGGGVGAHTIGDFNNSNLIRIGTYAHGLEFFAVVHMALGVDTTSGFVTYGNGEVGFIMQRKLKFSAPKSHVAMSKLALAQNNLQLGGVVRAVNEVDVVATATAS